MAELRSIKEIEDAHDILGSIIHGELPRLTKGDPSLISALIPAANVLCWVLGHGHNTTFGELLDEIKVVAAKLDYGWVDIEPPEKGKV